jgi:hypothetical protein
MVLRACDAVVEQPAQMFGAACRRMRPKNDDVRKLAVLGALDCHSKMTALLPEAQTRTITGGLPHELGNVRGGERLLHLRGSALKAFPGLPSLRRLGIGFGFRFFCGAFFLRCGFVCLRWRLCLHACGAFAPSILGERHRIGTVPQQTGPGNAIIAFVIL